MIFPKLVVTRSVDVLSTGVKIRRSPTNQGEETRRMLSVGLCVLNCWIVEAPIIGIIADQQRAVSRCFVFRLAFMTSRSYTHSAVFMSLCTQAISRERGVPVGSGCAALRCLSVYAETLLSLAVAVVEHTRRVLGVCVCFFVLFEMMCLFKDCCITEVCNK